MKFKRKISGEKNSEMIIIFQHWKSHFWSYYLVSKILSRNFCVVRYYYTKDIIVPDIRELLKNFEIILSDAKKLIDSVSEKYNSLTVVGFSIGSYLAFMLAKISTEVSWLFVFSSGLDFSDFIWYGNKTKAIRKKFIRKKIKIFDLENKLKKLSPGFNIEKIKSDLFLVLSKWDQTIPYTSGKKLILDLENKKINHSVKVHKYLSHFLIIFVYRLKMIFGYISDSQINQKY